LLSQLQTGVKRKKSVLAQATEDVTVFQMALQQGMMLQALPKG